MFAASQKTVVLGLPLLRATFADRANKEKARNENPEKKSKKNSWKIERKKISGRKVVC